MWWWLVEYLIGMYLGLLVISPKLRQFTYKSTRYLLGLVWPSLKEQPIFAPEFE